MMTIKLLNSAMKLLVGLGKLSSQVTLNQDSFLIAKKALFQIYQLIRPCWDPGYSIILENKIADELA